MGKFDTAVLDRIKAHEGILGIFADLPGFKTTAKGLKGPVFWRGGEDAEHLQVSRMGGEGGPWMFRDWVNGESVDVIEAVGRLNKTDFPETVRWLGEKLGVAVETEERPKMKLPPASNEDRLSALALIYEKAQALDDGTEAAAYFKGRGLLEVARAMGVKFCPAGKPSGLADDAVAERYGLKALAMTVQKRKAFAIYPIAVNGKLVLYRTRLLMSQAEAKKAGLISCHSTPKTMNGFKFPVLWPALPETLADGAEVVLTEGETDAMALRVLVPGIEARAILGSGRLTGDDPEFKAMVKANARVILAFQNDKASAEGIARLTEAFKRTGLTVTAYVPADGAKDWAEVLGYGTGPVEKLASIGAVFGDYAVGHMVRAAAKYADDLATGKLVHIGLPWPTLQQMMGGKGLPPGTLGLLASRTGVGKSWVAFHMSVHAATHGHKTFLLNTELQDSGVGARLLAIASGVGSVASMSDADTMKHLIYEHGAEISKLDLDVTQADLRTLDGVPDMLREQIDQGHRLLIIDHVGDLDSEGAEVYRALPAFAKVVRKLAHQRGAQILLVTHLRSGDAEDILAFSRQLEHVVDYSWALQGFEARMATCAKQGLPFEVEVNRLLVIRKNRYGPSDVKIGFTLDKDTMALVEHGIFKKWVRSRESASESDWTR